MARPDYIDLKFLKDFKNDKINHIARLEERINELNRIKNILLKDIERIETDIKEIENKE